MLALDTLRSFSNKRITTDLKAYPLNKTTTVFRNSESAPTFIHV